MLSLDSNCLLRWLLHDVPEQGDRVAALLALDTRYDVADVALVEVVFVLEKRMKLSRATVAAAIEQLAAQRSLVFDRAMWSDVMESYVSHPKLSAVDIYLAVRARAGAAEALLTFDQKLSRQEAGVRLVTSLPEPAPRQP